MGRIQETVRQGLTYLAGKVSEGAYGDGDDAFQDDSVREAFLEDLQDEVIGKLD